MRRRETPLPGVVLLEPRVFEDERGFFYESYNERTFARLGIRHRFVQDNHSRSRRGVVRGLHYQLPHAQAKLVRVTRGAVWDVAVDIRRGSPTFGRWWGVELSEENRLQLLIPEGFAHGFVALTDGAEVQYKVSAPYDPEGDRGIRWDDPDLAIAWPLDGIEPLLSPKDRGLPRLAEVEPEALPRYDVGEG